MARLIFLIVVFVAAIVICLLASYLVAYGSGPRTKRRNWWLTLYVSLFFLCAYGAFHYGEGYLPGALYTLGYGLDVAAFLFLWTIGATALVLLPFWIVFSALDRRARRRAQKEGMTFTDGESKFLDKPMSRRKFFKYMGLGLFGLFGGTSGIMAYEGQGDVVVKELTVRHDELPAHLEGYTIVQISDIHLGPFIDREDLKKLCHRLKDIQADRLVITGDLVDEMAWVNDAFETMGALTEHFPDGIDYILGNHEYFHDLPKVLAAAKASPLHFMRNSAQPLRPGDESAYVVGVDYPFKLTADQRRAFLNKALRAVPKGAFVILLAHHPQFMEEAFARQIPLTLAGHTHGGQINLFGVSLVPVGTEYWKGVYRQGRSVGYVNEGTGHWFPIRLNCPREITVIRLKRS